MRVQTSSRGLPGPSGRRAAHVRSAAGLARILDPDVNAVLWARERPASLADAAATSVESGDRQEAEVWLDRPTTLEPLVEPVRDPSLRDALLEDLTMLVSLYAAILDRKHVWVQLGVVTHDMCRKLHTDNVPVRLLCTYDGPGTDWVPDEDVRRENLGRVDVDLDEANRSVLRRPDAIRRTRPGEVLLLKGEAWPGNAGLGAVHRSPPIEGTGARRLLLKVDTAPCGC
ncbi:MAG TPA: DUF1826 domain-containing protein [Sandaracinaceae bacterium LLY-WYZ-13_1]|nr:DUF1826 domain-containing protein [Sandaracinaceae bacterium LLY-WYZ-13_1]